MAAALTEGFSFMCVLAEGFSMPWVVETVTALAPGWESELNGDKGFLQPCGFGHCTFQRGVLTIVSGAKHYLQRLTDISAWNQDSK